MPIKKYFIYCFLPFSLTLLTSCRHLIHLDRAQNNFNRGSALENQLRFNPQSDVSVSPAIYYTLAYAELGKAMANKTGQLRNDNVLASTYTLKALCEWKLKRYQKAEQSAKDALEEMRKMQQKMGKDAIALPRDEALMRALPFLMEIDKVKDTLYSFHSSTPPFEKGKMHYLQFIFDPDTTQAARLEEAIREIGRIQQTAGASEELAAYFTMARLAGLKTWSDALNFLLSCIREDDALQGADNRPAWEEARTWQKEQGDQHLDEREEELLEKLRMLAPGERGQRLSDYWAELIGG
ncbi:MAG: hypothetical protein J5I94_09850 [Phaeodactylibacter sp.]|nr:hypothetical protein [Phaeodactylibacter sp.]